MPLLTSDDLKNMTPLFRGRAGESLGRGLMHIMSVDKVNDLYDRHADSRGPDFAREILADIGVSYEVLYADILDRLPEGPFIVICNHPYGSIDGVMLVDLFGRRRPDFKVMANKFLSRIEPLKDNFICVTPTGTQRTAPTADSIQGIKDAISHVRSGGCLGIFPSGAVSDLSIMDGCIRDRQWQEPVLRLIQKLKVPIIPVHFLDRNSNFYYSLGLINWRVRLLRLPAEVFNKCRKRTRIAIGEIISPEEQQKFTDTTSFGNFLRERVYKHY